MKAIPRRYTKAPITEAVIAVNCELAEDIGLSELLAVHTELRDDYPKRAEQFKLHFQLDPGAEPTTRVQPREVVGYQLASVDESRAVRIGLTEFAFAQLAPYDCWEALRSEAKRVWDV